MTADIVEVEVEEGGVRKKQRVEYVGSGKKTTVVEGCGCKSGCSTGRCSCRKASRKCGPQCRCINCKNQ